MMPVLYVYLQIIHSYPPTVQEEPYHRMYHPRHYADRVLLLHGPFITPSIDRVQRKSLFLWPLIPHLPNCIFFNFVVEVTKPIFTVLSFC